MQIGLIKQPCCLCCHIWSDEDYQIDQFKSLPEKKEDAEAIVQEDVSKPNAWETSMDDGNYLKNEALENSFNDSKNQSLNGSKIQSAKHDEKIQQSLIQSLSGSDNQSFLDDE